MTQIQQQTNEKKPILRLIYDYVFRSIFSDPNDTDIVKHFIASVIDIPVDEFEVVDVVNPNLIKEHETDKSIILDARILTKSGHSIDIEVQRATHDSFINRTIYYNSKNLVAQMSAGDKYGALCRSISIIIIDFEIFADENYRHRFMYYDFASQIMLSDITELNFLELPKLPKSADGTTLYDWLSLFKAEREDEMDAIAEKDPIFKKTVTKVRYMSASETERYIAEAEEKQRDREQSLYDTGLRIGREEAAKAKEETVKAQADAAKAQAESTKLDNELADAKEKETQTIINLLKSGIGEELIAESMNLPLAEIRKLKQDSLK
ncbi:MAG: Rpn family recombination-promoting nuclease/putative transposase [Clostridiales Family XIII bacterium]|jgi:predicted transposase/invertase (TIGR01784 family)|nr:Rpn family recombination-promoting nuclease/putative transposase [Clostridiales Family XIII bacterium]